MQYHSAAPLGEAVDGQTKSVSGNVNFQIDSDLHLGRVASVQWATTLWFQRLRGLPSSKPLPFMSPSQPHLSFEVKTNRVRRESAAGGRVTRRPVCVKLSSKRPLIRKQKTLQGFLQGGFSGCQLSYAIGGRPFSSNHKFMASFIAASVETPCLLAAIENSRWAS